MSAKLLIGGGVAAVAIGAWVFRSDLARLFGGGGVPDPNAGIKPGIAPGSSLFQGLCRTAATSAGVAAAGAYGAPPQASAGIAKPLSGVACSAVGAVAAIAGKSIGQIGSDLTSGSIGATTSGATKTLLAVGTGGLSLAVPGIANKIGGSASSAATGVASALGLGSSKIGRAPNGKDVFPNDARNCRDFLGVTDWRACGNLYDVKNQRWPVSPWPR